MAWQHRRQAGRQPFPLNQVQVQFLSMAPELLPLVAPELRVPRWSRLTFYPCAPVSIRGPFLLQLQRRKILRRRLNRLLRKHPPIHIAEIPVGSFRSLESGNNSRNWLPGFRVTSPATLRSFTQDHRQANWNRAANYQRPRSSCSPSRHAATLTAPFHSFGNPGVRALLQTLCFRLCAQFLPLEGSFS